MEEDLYDEFGNYIGPDLAEGSADSESEDWDRTRASGRAGTHQDDGDAMDLDEGARFSPTLLDHALPL